MSEPQRFGARIRALRQRDSMTQAELARRLEISSSYLNLIEHDRRPLSAPLLIRLTKLFKIDIQDFDHDGDRHLRQELLEVFADPIFENHDISTTDLRELCLSAPAAAEAAIHLYRVFRSTRESAEALAEQMSTHLVGPSIELFNLPSEEVSDFLQRKMNYFPDLEQAAEQLWRDAALSFEDLQHGLVRYLKENFNVSMRLLRPGRDGDATRAFDPRRGVLELSESLPPGSRMFQIAHQIALIGQKDLLDRLADDPILTTDASRKLCRVALANYFAGAVLMPYDSFLRTAREDRYDVDLLSVSFGVNFEQVCHRLTTLRKPHAEGVPFHFVRVDIAGNISKRFSASGIKLVRSGCCPRWNLHAAFLTPGRIISQLSRMPDDTCYFCIARTVTREARGYHVPRMIHAVTLGCRLEHAGELVYADGIDLANTTAAVPIGSNCRLCERTDCKQRAFPSLHHKLRINENRRGISFYAPLPDDS